MDDDGIPICKLGLCMHKDGYEATKHCAKYRYPKANRKSGRAQVLIVVTRDWGLKQTGNSAIWERGPLLSPSPLRSCPKKTGNGL